MITIRRAGITLMAGLMSLLLLRSAHADWLAVDLTQVVPGDPTVVLTGPSNADPFLTVQSTTPGDLKWIKISLPVTTAQTIQAVEICYQAPDAGTVIRQTRLVEYLDSTHGLVRHDDPTVHASLTAMCYRSRVRGYTPADAVSLLVRLQFAEATDAVVIDSVRIQVKPVSVTPNMR
jgi:hypothetical protein